MRDRSLTVVTAVATLAGLAATSAAQCGGGAQAASSGWDCHDTKAAAQTRQASYNVAGDIVDTAVGAGQFETLVAAVKAAGLVEALKGPGPFTVFAPTDEAFGRLADGTVESLLKPENRELLRTVLAYHVVPGNVMAKDVVRLRNAGTLSGQQVDVRVESGTVFIDGAKVTATDIKTSNGVIHVIDSVIMPETKSIPEVADEAGSFSTLLAAVKAAGLDATLMGDGPFTVFAPTDEAFAALGSTVTELLKPNNRHKLADILTYHVVPGRVFATDALKAGHAKTVEGGEVVFGVDDAKLTVNNATIISTDVEASNGVIHVIDSVLMP